MKNLVLFALLVLCSVSTYAQGKYQFSFIASPQFSWLNSDSDFIESDGSRTGFAFGILSDRFIDNDQRYSLHSGFIVSTLGGKVTNTSSLTDIQGTPLPVDLKYKMTNIEVPLSLKLRTAQFMRNTYFVQFGLTQWFNVSDEIDVKNDNVSKDQFDSVKFYNIGYNVGAGMEFDIGGDNAITMGVIYQNGFLDATENDSIDDEMKVNNIRVQLGLVF